MPSVIKVDQIQSDTGRVNLASNISFTGSATIDSPVITGNVNIDSGLVFTDAVNNRVGIGTQNPSEVFQVNGAIYSTTNALNFNQTGAHFDYFSGGARINAYLSTGSSVVFHTNASGGSSREVARVNPSGAFTAPFQPAFIAALSGNRSSPGGGAYARLTSWTRISNSIINARDSGFNTSTGRFTAPVAGLYLMGLHIDMSSSVSTSYYLTIGINGAERTYDLLEDVTMGTNGGFYVTRVIPMAINDYAEVYMSGGAVWTLNGAGEQYHTRWEGFLIS